MIPTETVPVATSNSGALAGNPVDHGSGKERDAEVPAFLRMSLVLMASAAAAYLIVYMYGDGLVHAIGAAVALFFVAVSVLAANKSQE